MIRADHAVARVHRCAFHDGQDVALHTFAAHVWPVAALTPGDLVDFIEEDDTAGLNALYGGAIHLVHVDEAAFFFLNQVIEAIADLHLALLGPATEDVR